jgi:DNA invertase Pin-like site-specific DNA recombinase
MKVAIYARVSTDDKGQDPETQLYALRGFCERAGWEIFKIYVDQARAKDFNHRTAWRELLEDVKQRQFKAVLVYKLDRAFRSVRECCNYVHDWDERGIKFIASTQDIDTTTAMGRYFLHNLAAVAELESALTSDRVTAGIARTRAQGKPWGRKPKPFDWGKVFEALKHDTVTDVARDTGYSRARIYRAIKENENAKTKTN